MRNTTEKIIKIAFIAVTLIFLIIMLTSCRASAQATTFGAIGENQYMITLHPGEVRLALMTPEDKNGVGGYRIGKAKSIRYSYEGTPRIALDLIAEEYTLAGLSFPCFCDAIGAQETPASLQYYERCQEIKCFVDSLNTTQP